MRSISRFMLSSAFALSISALGCESSKNDSTGSTDTTADSTDSVDAADSTDGADATAAGDGADAADSDATDAADATDAPDATDAADGVESSDSVDGVESSDSVDGVESADSTDGVESADSTDGVESADSTDGVESADSTDVSDSADATDGGPCPDAPVFAAPKTHMVSLVIPAGVADFKCDSDNSGAIDAKDGELNALLAGTLKSFFDVNGLLAANVAEGDIVLIADLAGTMTDGEGEDLTINMYLGEKIDPATASCFDVEVTATDKDGAATATTWDGESKCDFSIDPKSFTAGQCPYSSVVQIGGASVADGLIDAGPVTFNFSLPLGVITLDVEIETGRFNGTVTDAFRVTDGRLCGQIPFAKLKQAFEDVCLEDPTQQLCSFKGIALPIIEGECKKSGDTNCTISIALESAEAGALTLATPAEPE